MPNKAPKSVPENRSLCVSKASLDLAKKIQAIEEYYELTISEVLGILAQLLLRWVGHLS